LFRCYFILIFEKKTFLIRIIWDETCNTIQPSQMKKKTPIHYFMSDITSKLNGNVHIENRSSPLYHRKEGYQLIYIFKIINKTPQTWLKLKFSEFLIWNCIFLFAKDL